MGEGVCVLQGQEGAPVLCPTAVGGSSVEKLPHSVTSKLHFAPSVNKRN